MKNIHILKTNKPSRLLKDLVDGTYQFKKEVLYGNRFELPLSIYITSDEEIKEGDWIFDLDINRIVKADNLKVITSKKSQCWYYKKIILTTDQDLIKEGVQAIDDEFLEWFVKNPSCEKVKIELKTKQLVKPYDVYNESVSYYKIIIPKEEPKQEIMYSEEEVLDILREHTAEIFKGSKLTLTEWFEQFKNK